MYRNRAYDEDLAKELQDPKGAQAFILALMEGEDGMELEAALRHAIRRMGVKEFSVKSEIAMPNVMSFLAEKRKLKQDSLDRFLRPFRLKTRIVVEKAS